jgi:hypothetical protein
MEIGADTVNEVASGSSGPKRTVLVLVGVAAIMAATSAIQLMRVSQDADKAEVRVSRLQSEAHTRYATSASLRSLITRLDVELAHLEFDIGVKRSGSPSDRWIAAAEWRAHEHLTPVVEELEDLPTNPALSPFLQRVISSDLDDNKAALDSIPIAMAKADAYSNDERIAAQSLFALTLAIALLALSGIASSRRARRLTLGVASTALLLSAVLVSTTVF